MIYLFNESKTLFSIVSREELLSFLYEREVNALYQASVEMPVQSTDKNGLTRNLYNEMQNATYFGHYDLNDKFQLHKIVSIDVTGDSFITTAVHLFFDEAKALAVTEERRFIDRPIEDSVIYAFGLIGWTLDEFDVSDAKTVSFFNDTVLEAQAKIIKTFGFKFDYWLDFDGQKITSKKVKVKEELGTQTHQRYVYGHNTLGIKMETDFSEIYTAVLGRGHGERIENLDDEGNETEDTFGRRIEFDEVEWSISSGDPLDKDLGERILVDPVSTQIFGYVREDDTVAPRVKVVEFSDVEDKEELIQASYDWLMENNSPKAVYSVEVLETEELDLGDEVYVVYRDIDFVKSARVSRVVDDLLTERRAVEFGDSDYFRRNSETSRLQRDLQDTKNDSADYIQDLIRQSNARIDAEMQQARDDFEQALIVAQAEIDAAEQRMAELIGQTREDFDTEFNAEVERIEQEAQQEYNDIRDKIESDISDARTEMETEFEAEVERIEQEALAEYNRIYGEITDSIGQARTEIEQDYSQAVQGARDYADAEILAKEQQYEEDWNIRDAEIQSTIEQIVGGSVDSLDSNLLEVLSDLQGKVNTQEFTNLTQDYEATILRVGEAETAIGTFQATADGLSAQFANYQTDFGNDVQVLTAQVASYDASVNGFRSEVGVLQTDVDNIDNWIETKGTVIDQTADAITARVWQSDIDDLVIGGRNLLPNSKGDSLTGWRAWNSTRTNMYLFNFRGHTWIRSQKITSNQAGFDTPVFSMKANKKYIVSLTVRSYSNSGYDLNYLYLRQGESSISSVKELPNVSLRNTDGDGSLSGDGIRVSFEVSHDTDVAEARILIALTGNTEDAGFIAREFKIEEGDKATAWTPAPEDSLMKTDFVLRSDGFFLGGNYVGGEHYSTAIIGDANGLKLLGDTIIDGNLYVKETIESYALNVVEANVGSLFANTANIDFIRARHINTNAIGAKHLWVDTALIDKLSTSYLFTNMLSAQTLEAIDANIGSVRTTLLTSNVITSDMIQSSNATIDKLFSSNARIDRLYTKTHFVDKLKTSSLEAVNANIGSLRTSILTSNVITSGMIQSSNATINKLFSTNARIDTLVSKTHFVDEIHTMSLNAVHGDIANLRTNILTSDVIKSTHMSASNLMVDKMFGTTALIERLTSKTAFISYIRSHIIDTNHIRVGFNGISSNVTISSSGIVIDGGALTVNRDDGGAPTIIQGYNPSGVYLYPSTPNRRDSGFTLDGQYARRSPGTNLLIYDFYMFEWFYTDLIVDFAIYNYENYPIRVRMEIFGTDGSSFSRTVDYTIPSSPVRVAFPRMILRLGVPDGSVQRFFIRTRSVGTSDMHGRYGLHTYMVKHLDNGHGYPRLEDNGL